MPKVIEIFKSIQGEGLDIGLEVVFVRFAGCNLNCTWCDTDWVDGELMDLELILKRIYEIDCNYVILTGGEPLIQESEFLKELTTTLSDKGYKVGIETNGQVLVKELKVDLMAISPKLKSSHAEGKEFSHFGQLFELLRRYPSFLKFVISDEQDMLEVDEILDILMDAGIDLPEIVIQPEESKDNYKELPALWKKTSSFYNLVEPRFIPQVHKLMGVK